MARRRLIRSYTLKQPLGKYAFRLVAGKARKVDILTSSLYAKPPGDSDDECLCIC